MLDRDTFVRRLDEKSETLYRIAYSLLRSDEACRDALQEAALRAWEHRASLRDDARFDAWFIRILINCCRSIGRRERRYVLRETVEPPRRPAPDPELQSALEALPESLRLPVVLHYLQGMRYDEIARVLRLPSSTVRSRLSRGRAALRKWLTDEEVEQP